MYMYVLVSIFMETVVLKLLNVVAVFIKFQLVLFHIMMVCILSCTHNAHKNTHAHTHLPSQARQILHK